jgi:hypothetical protein
MNIVHQANRSITQLENRNRELEGELKSLLEKRSNVENGTGGATVPYDALDIGQCKGNLSESQLGSQYLIFHVAKNPGNVVANEQSKLLTLGKSSETAKKKSTDSISRIAPDDPHSPSERRGKLRKKVDRSNLTDAQVKTHIQPEIASGSGTNTVFNKIGQCNESSPEIQQSYAQPPLQPNDKAKLQRNVRSSPNLSSPPGVSETINSEHEAVIVESLHAWTDETPIDRPVSAVSISSTHFRHSQANTASRRMADNHREENEKLSDPVTLAGSPSKKRLSWDVSPIDQTRLGDFSCSGPAGCVTGQQVSHIISAASAAFCQQLIILQAPYLQSKKCLDASSVAAKRPASIIKGSYHKSSKRSRLSSTSVSYDMRSTEEPHIQSAAACFNEHFTEQHMERGGSNPTRMRSATSEAAQVFNPASNTRNKKRGKRATSTRRKCPRCCHCKIY